MSKELDALSGVETPSLTDFWNWVKKTFTISYQSEVEAYLADSVDYVDYENRVRNLQRRGMI
jgi:hypothetical protein